VVARASHVISTEIRAHVKALPGAQGIDFVRAAIERGDADTVSAILGAPPYLSGIDHDTQAVLLRMWNERANPLAGKRLRAMQAASELLQRWSCVRGAAKGGWRLPRPNDRAQIHPCTASRAQADLNQSVRSGRHLSFDPTVKISND
jgi:hypothetical protein